MFFLNPWGFLALLLLLPIILLYMLKQQHEDKVVSSTMLWQEVLKDLQAARPWQKLKTRLLLILQILAILLFTLSLTRPAFTGTSDGIHYIAVMDTSAKMQAVDIKPSRMERAKEELKSLIQAMKPNDTMTIVKAGLQPFIIADETGNKAFLRDYVDGIAASNTKSDISLALQMAQTVSQKSNLYEIHLFSSESYDGKDTSDDHVHNHIFHGIAQNAAVTNVAYSINNDEITVLSQIKNYGDDANITLELEVDGDLINIKEIFVTSGEVANIYWSGIKEPASILKVSISEEDDLKLDNVGFAVVDKAVSIKTLLVAQRNVFIEKALSLRKDIELIKTNAEEASDVISSNEFGIQIYDGVMPKELPGNGHLLIFSDAFSGELGIESQGEINPGSVHVNEQTIYKELISYLETESYNIAKAAKITVPKSFDVLLKDSRDNPLLIAGELDGRKIAIFTFLLHNSDIPLKVDFPILMQNLLNWMLPPVVDNSRVIYPEEALPLMPLPGTSVIKVISPSNKEYTFDSYPAPLFYDTSETGVYKVIQHMDGDQIDGYFIVSVPTSDVSNLSSSANNSPVEAGQSSSRTKGTITEEIWMLAGWLLLVLLLTEWWVYHHGI